MFAAAVISFFFSLALIAVLVRVAGSLQLADIPGGRKMHTSPVPRIGGIAIALSTLIVSVVWFPMTPPALGFAVGGTMLGIMGVLDDRLDLDFRSKLGTQVAAAGIAVLCGIVLPAELPAAFLLSTIPYVLTLIFLIGVTNAINFVDGLDGLAAGYSVITLCLLALIANSLDVYWISLTASAMIGSLFGFLRYNTHPARIFMGDAGSQFLGFGIAVLAIALAHDRPADLNPLFPIVLLGLPLLDVGFVVAIRLRAGRSPFSADRNHLHHQLLELGLSHGQAVSLIYLLQALFAATAFCFRKPGQEPMAAMILGIGAALLGFIEFARARHWRVQGTSGRPAALANGTSWIGIHRRLVSALPFAIDLCLSAILVGGALKAEQVGTDAGLSALAVAAAYMLALWVRKRWSAPVCRFSIFLAFVLINAFLPIDTDAGPWHWAINGVLLGIAGSVIFLLRYSNSHDFVVTPQDLLILCLIALLIAIPTDRYGINGAGTVLVRCAVLFYASEVTASGKRSPAQAVLLNGGALLCLLIFTVKGLQA